MMEHELKTWTPFYASMVSVEKLFDVRKNDRNFQVGDTLNLREWDNKKEKYTGRKTKKEVTFILKGGAFGIKRGYIVMGVRSVGKIHIELDSYHIEKATIAITNKLISETPEITIEKAAVYLGISVRTLFRWAAKYKLKFPKKDTRKELTLKKAIELVEENGYNIKKKK